MSRKRRFQPGPQGEGKSKFSGFIRPRTKGPAYIIEDQAEWTPEERAAKLAEMRKWVAEHGPTPGAAFIIFEHLDGTRERLDRNP